MRKIHPLTTAGFGFIAASIPLLLSGYAIPASACALIAFSLVGPEVPKYTTWFQTIGYILSGAVLGFTLDYQHHQVPYNTIALFLITFSIFIRLIFYKDVIHTRYLWIDPLTLLLGVAAWVGGNIYYHEGWLDWFFPLLPLLFSVMLVTGFLKEGTHYKKMAEGENQTRVGSAAPDFELPDQHGMPVRLSELKGKRSVLLIFIRGDWCPACHMMLRTYEKSNSKLREKNVLLLAIGPDDLGTNKVMAEKVGVEFRILADPDHNVARAYGTRLEKDPVNNPMRNAKGDEGLYLPSSFVISTDGIIRYNSRADQAGEFLNPEKIFKVLADLDPGVV